MTTKIHNKILLSDYRPPAYLIPETHLSFDLDPEATTVTCRMNLVPNPEALAPITSDLILNGEDLKLLSISLNGRLLSADDFSYNGQILTIPVSQSENQLEIKQQICPRANTSLEGLYLSRGMFCTQNEPEGFRHITFYSDRSDVMSRFTTVIRGDKESLPVMLSNGNLISSRDLEDGRHEVCWQDPFPKPCYLFALVAGKLACIKRNFTSMSGRQIELRIYVEAGNERRAGWALECLSDAMRWDEERFGREYDLDIFMIVAVDDFNFGAMENKGLNIFNASAVLANEITESDANFDRIREIVAHEYFHNWTGNRVTLRDWFQLTLKEGLTVYRDQEFTADTISRPVKRIDDAAGIRDLQFAEDASPMSHPIRPSEYIEINNFYTQTVYEKGAEVIRMIATLAGRDAFRKGMDEYFRRYDGKAVTTEDFLSAMEAGTGLDLKQFSAWYRQAGTPTIEINSRWNEKDKTLSLNCRQSIAGHPDAEILHIPLKLGILNSEGLEFPLKLKDRENCLRADVLSLTKKEETFVFSGIDSSPVLSLLRSFSAPVKINYAYSTEDLIFLTAHDSDLVNRYEAAQRLAEECILGETAGIKTDQRVFNVWGSLLNYAENDPSWCAEVIIPPSILRLLGDRREPDFEKIYQSREDFMRKVFEQHEEKIKQLYRTLALEPYSRVRKSINRRRLKNNLLAFLRLGDQNEAASIIFAQYRRAENMTDRLAALASLCQMEVPQQGEALADFYRNWKHETLVMNKYFAVQASSTLPQTLSRVMELEKDPAYDERNPNKLRALLGAFSANLLRFHDLSSQAYEFLADRIIKVNAYNPMMASRLANAFSLYPKLDAKRRLLMKQQLQRIQSAPKLSKDVYEVVGKYLASCDG